MASKVFAGFIVAFWLTMMVALVRFEFYPKAVPLGEVSTERLLQKIVASREPARMNVYYRNAVIGLCAVDIVPLASRDARPADALEGVPKAYLVHSELDMKLAFFGTPSHFHLDSYTRLTPRYEIYDFNLRTSIGESSVEVQGDDRSKKINVMVDAGETHDKHQFDFDALRGGGLGSLLGIPGLANLGFPGPAAFGTGGGNGFSRPNIRVTEDRFSYAGISQRAYLVEIRSPDSMWAKIWVADSGEMLRVDTSVGVTMVSDLIDNIDNPVRERMSTRRTRGKGRRGHDSN
jgi:hypothetical protein